jgi:hypothetical protein
VGKFLAKLYISGAGRLNLWPAEKIYKKGLTDMPEKRIMKMFQEGTERKETP